MVGHIFRPLNSDGNTNGPMSIVLYKCYTLQSIEVTSNLQVFARLGSVHIYRQRHRFVSGNFCDLFNAFNVM